MPLRPPACQARRATRSAPAALSMQQRMRAVVLVQCPTTVRRGPVIPPLCRCAPGGETAPYDDCGHREIVHQVEAAAAGRAVRDQPVAHFLGAVAPARQLPFEVADQLRRRSTEEPDRLAIEILV